MANLIFSPLPVCVVEISTFLDLGSTEPFRPTPAQRTGLAAHPGLRWNTLRLPLSQLLVENHVGGDFTTLSQRKRDIRILHLDRVPLSSHDLNRTAAILAKCPPG